MVCASTRGRHAAGDGGLEAESTLQAQHHVLVAGDPEGDDRSPPLCQAPSAAVCRRACAARDA